MKAVNLKIFPSYGRVYSWRKIPDQPIELWKYFCLKSLLTKLNDKRNTEIGIAREEYHKAKVRAKSEVYEKKEVIGGTIVGCIGRLESIRKTKPFAILVEEASEVLEPLLFSCLGEATMKFEMIGDHLQLKPSIMSKIMFERVNR